MAQHTSMTRESKRLRALLLGVLLALTVAVGAAAVRYRGRLLAHLPLWVYQSTIHVSESPQNGECIGPVNAIRVISEATRDHLDPLSERHFDYNGQRIRAEFSSSWAETRVVLFAEKEGAITIRASFDTDYGVYPGSVNGTASRVHKHPDKVCFSLSIRRMDGSSIQERWEGQLSIR